MKKKYFTEEEKKEANRAKWRRSAHKNREKKRAYSEQWRKEHPKETRANSQYNTYKRMDIRNGFGDAIDFDVKWIIENIYTKPCVHCGETDWRKLGCNRIDNDLPHTKDNVESCCYECNIKLSHDWISDKLSKQIDQIDKESGAIINTWKNAEIASKALNLNSAHIRSCCRGERKTHGGYIWKTIKK